MRLAGIVLGLGLGGFVDGIALHQIMQWHNMGSAVLPPTTMDAMAKNGFSLIGLLVARGNRALPPTRA